MSDLLTVDPRTARSPFTPVLGAAVVGFSALYFLSDVLELVHGGFTTPQLVITYIAEAAIPVFVLGLSAAQRPRIGTLGLVGAVGYAYAFVFFTGTVLLALVDQSPDWDSLVGDLEPWVTIHGALMLAAGVALGLAVVRAGVLPRWTAFAGMGLSLLARARHIRTTSERNDVHVHP